VDILVRKQALAGAVFQTNEKFLVFERLVRLQGLSVLLLCLCHLHSVLQLVEFLACHSVKSHFLKLELRRKQFFLNLAFCLAYFNNLVLQLFVCNRCLLLLKTKAVAVQIYPLKFCHQVADLLFETQLDVFKGPELDLLAELSLHFGFLKLFGDQLRVLTGRSFLYLLRLIKSNF
jgi:hypothetical protein